MTKPELRIHIKELFQKPPVSLADESKRICKKIISSRQLAQARVLLVYMALPDEVSLAPVIEAAVSSQKAVYAPRIITGTNLMEFYRLGGEATRAGAFGIQEPPATAQRFDPQAAQDGILVLVPGRAFSPDGSRLGRGKGFYDVFLSELGKKNRACVAGVCFPFQVVESVPADRHDVKMSLLFF